MTVLWFFSEIIYYRINPCLAPVSSKQGHFIHFWYSVTSTRITGESRHLRSPVISQNDPSEFTLAALKESHSFTFILHVYANMQILFQVEAQFSEHRNILGLFGVRAVESYLWVRSGTGTESCIGFDRSWSCTRHAWHYIDLITNIYWKLYVNFMLVSKIAINFWNIFERTCQGTETERLKKVFHKFEFCTHRTTWAKSCEIDSMPSRQFVFGWIRLLQTKKKIAMCCVSIKNIEY
jgi:hypothetical protein